MSWAKYCYFALGSVISRLKLSSQIVRGRGLIYGILRLLFLSFPSSWKKITSSWRDMWWKWLINGKTYLLFKANRHPQQQILDKRVPMTTPSRIINTETKNYFVVSSRGFNLIWMAAYASNQFGSNLRRNCWCSSTMVRRSDRSTGRRFCKS